MILLFRFNLFKLLILFSYVTLCHWQCFIWSQLLPGRCLPRYCPATHVSRAPAAPALGSCHTLLIGQRHPADSDTRCFMNSTSPGSQTMASSALHIRHCSLTPSPRLSPMRCVSSPGIICCCHHTVSRESWVHWVATPAQCALAAHWPRHFRKLS